MRTPSFGVALATTLVVAAWPAASAWAQDSDVILRPRSRNFETPQHFALEFRIAPYIPQIDDDPGLNGQTPYEDTFGDNPRVLVAAEFDWQVLRIPYFGTVGPGFSIGYVSASRPAKQLNSEELSGDDTTLQVIPMYAVGVVRADALPRHLGIPLVPYAKAGVGYAPWRTYTSGGTSYVDGANGQRVNGKGATWGIHAAAGLAFQMDVLDRHAAKNLDESVGINHCYLFAEWMFAMYNGIAQDNVLRVGTSTWVAGLSFEF